MVWVGGWVQLGTGVCMNHKSENRIKLCQLGCDLLDFQRLNMTPDPDPPTHGWGFSTNHKSSNRIELS